MSMIAPEISGLVRFRSNELLIDDAHLVEVTRLLWRAGVEVAGITEHPGLGTTRCWLHLCDGPGLLDVIDGLFRPNGMWGEGAVRVNHVFRLASHWHFLPADDASPGTRLTFPDSEAGKGRRVGVIDTGIDRRHRWMSKRYVKASGSAVVDTPVKTSFEDLERWEGHGTFVVGLIRQLAPKATIHVAWPTADEYPPHACAACARPRFQRAMESGKHVDQPDDDDMDGGEIDDVAVAEAILSFGRKRMDVLNLSFGGETLDLHEPSGVARKHAVDPDHLELGKVVRGVLAQGTKIVASAGNSGSDAPVYPAAIPGVVAVGSGEDGDHRDGFSSFGDWVKEWRPGKDAHSSFLMDLKWARWSGTSFAAPKLTGELAASPPA
jgi:hypothetical protein